MAEDVPWVKFSQSEDLTVRLRNILHDYAFGPGVFRELLQNADDAGARRFALLADGRQHPSRPGSGLIDDRLGAWQGPAACAFNDAAFSDADFEGICRVGASGKRGDGSKIGQYGLGFNATYHLSDVVSFASRDRLCIFDPHVAHLPGDLPGLQLPLTEEAVGRYRSQLSPFEDAAKAFGAATWPLEGAIFRLPLRTPALAARSQICPESHDYEELLGVLHELLRGAHELLLFLQSVESIEVLARAPGDAAPRRLGGASLRAASAASAERLRRERRLLARAECGTARAGAVRACYAVLIGAAAANGGQPGDGADEATAWLVVSRSEPAPRAAGGEAAAGDELPKRQTGSVALRLWPPVADSALPGGAFCFLPLSITTGLPAHVSANFALTANRRDLWRRSDDRASSHGTRRAAWNEALLSGTLPRAYADALELRAQGLKRLEAAQLSDDAPTSPGLVSLLPSGAWDEELYSVCPAAELWGSFPAGGHAAFEGVPAAVAAEVFSRGSAVLWDEVQAKFVGPKAALLCSEAHAVRLGRSDALADALRKLRVAGSRRSVVEVPERVRSVLEEVKGATWLSPQTLATALRCADSSGALSLTHAEADAVVEYLLGSEGAGPLSLLRGLRICPLLGGGLGCFDDLSSTGVCTIWWADDAELSELLPGASFVDPASLTFRLLRPRAATAPLNLRPINARALAELLPVIVPTAWRGKRKVWVSDGTVLVDGQDARQVQAEADANGLRPAPGLAPERQPKASQPVGAKSGRGAQPAARAPAGGRKAPKANVGRSAAADYDDYGGEDYYDDWGEEEDWAEDDDGEEPDGSPASEGAPAAAKERPDERPCVCLTPEDVSQVVRRCEILWRVAENAHEKGANPVQLLGEFPCIPVAASDARSAAAAASRVPLLINVQEAMKTHALSAEDFSVPDRECLERCGVPFIRPGRQLRKAIGIERASVLAALQAALTDRGGEAAAAPPGANPRLFVGLRAHRLPMAEARALRSLISSFLQRRLIPKDLSAIEALPIFETQGGEFAVPLSPVSRCVVAPSEEWDEALRPVFGDFLVSWDGEAGAFLADLGKDRGSPVAFLAKFAAPRIGLLEKPLCLKFLEVVASLGKTPWKQIAPKDHQVIGQACSDAPLVVFPDGTRKRCTELADPGDATLSQVLGQSAIFPPDDYRAPLPMFVMRQAGLRRFSNDSVFLEAARHVDEQPGHQRVELGSVFLKYLGENSDSLKWPTKSYSALGRLRIFPVIDALGSEHHMPPTRAATGGAPVRAVSLDGAVTLFRHAAAVWTRAFLLDPAVFDAWPDELWRKFGSLGQTPPLSMVVDNLEAVVARWAAADGTDGGAGCAVPPETITSRQGVVAKHLELIHPRRSQWMGSGSLAKCAFILLDDGQFKRPSDVFTALHSGGDSDAEVVSDEEGEEGEVLAKAKSSGKRRAKKSAPGAPEASERTGSKTGLAQSASPWALPAYLRPFRRLLLSLAGPCVSEKKAPSIYVSMPPSAGTVAGFLEKALNQPELADVEFMLHPEGGAECKVYAHRLILAASCEHFYKAFTSGCSEAVGKSSRAQLDMPEWVTPLALLWMLAYLYQGFDPAAARQTAVRLEAQMTGNHRAMPDAAGATRVVRGARGGKLRLSSATAMDSSDELCCLLRLSEFYDLNHLKTWCESRIQTLLSPETLVALSTHAFFCNAPQLLRVCVYHMQMLFADLVGTEDWEILEPAVKDLVLTGVEGSNGAAPSASNGAAPSASNGAAPSASAVVAQ